MSSALAVLRSVAVMAPVDGELSGAGTAQGGKVGATAEVLADVVGVGAHVKTFGAVHGEVDLGQGDAVYSSSR